MEEIKAAAEGRPQMVDINVEEIGHMINWADIDLDHSYGLLRREYN